MNIWLEMLPFIITGAGVAALHSSLPTHWLPFALASRAQKWSYSRLMSIVLIAGTGHILTTMVIGAALVWLSLKLDEHFETLTVYISAGVIFLFGAHYIYQHLKGKRHTHCENHNHHHHDYNKSAKDGWAILSLLSILTFSPCESFIPIYLSAGVSGWPAFLVLSGVLMVGTLASMMLFTSLAYFGMKRLNFSFVEDYEKLIIGIILVLLSIVFVILETGHYHSH